MKQVRNLVMHASGLILCDLYSNGAWSEYSIEANEEYEIHESSEWPDIKPCPQAEKDAHALSEARLAFKADRELKVNNLTISTGKGVFDADETSQTRMSRAIAVMSDSDTNVWVLADNTPIEVTKADLIEALILAGKAQSALWVQS